MNDFVQACSFTMEVLKTVLWCFLCFRLSIFLRMDGQRECGVCMIVILFFSPLQQKENQRNYNAILLY